MDKLAWPFERRSVEGEHPEVSHELRVPLYDILGLTFKYDNFSFDALGVDGGQLFLRVLYQLQRSILGVFVFLFIVGLVAAVIQLVQFKTGMLVGPMRETFSIVRK